MKLSDNKESYCQYFQTAQTNMYLIDFAQESVLTYTAIIFYISLIHDELLETLRSILTNCISLTKGW